MAPRKAAEHDSPRSGAPGRAIELLPAVAVSATFLGMLAFTWGKWPDVLVDFGVELYVPWQLGLGKVLGRDIAGVVNTGPLSPYLNALLFTVFGTGLRTLVVANLAVLAGLTALLFVLLRELGDRFSATLACLAFLTIFAFGQYEWIGNSNYVTPYSHGATHGLLLAHLSLLFLWRHARTGATWNLAAASAALGLVFLTKPEIFVAAAAAFAFAAVIALRDAPDGRARLRRSLALALPAVVPTLVAFGLLAASAGAAAATQGTFAPWLAIDSPLTRIPFYRWSLGLDDPARNLLAAAIWLAGYVAAFGSAAVLDWYARSARARWIAAAVGAAVLGAATWALVPTASWLEVARPLPAIVAAGGVAAALIAWRRPRPCPPAAMLHAAYAIFAALLLLKMALNARLYQYGFALAMPATLLLVTWLGASVPRRLRAHGASGIAFRAITASLVAVVVAAYVHTASRFYAAKTEKVGEGPDAFLADGRAPYVNATLQALSVTSAAGASLAVLPEGAMINYLARRANPSPYLTHMPDTLALWGEARLLAALRTAPPELVLIVHRDAAEHGARLFGRDYALDTWRWVQERYEPLGSLGGSPFEPAGYGLLLLRLKAGGAPEPRAGSPRP